MEFHRTMHFLQDRTSCHASKRIKNFLVTKPFEVINWPGNSPDLNLIENCWNYLKDEDPGSVHKLITATKMLWAKDLSRDYLKKLSHLMPRRIQKVLDVKGDATSY
jgi:hypothetical protein